MKAQKWEAPEAHLAKLRRIAFSDEPLQELDAEVMRWREAASAFHKRFDSLPQNDVAALVEFSDSVAAGATYTPTTDDERFKFYERYLLESRHLAVECARKLVPTYKGWERIDWEPSDGLPTDFVMPNIRKQWVQQEVRRQNLLPRTRPKTPGAVEQELKRARGVFEARVQARARHKNGAKRPSTK